MLIVLIGCSKQKAKCAAIPCLLYKGTRFQLALDKAIGPLQADRIFAISAKHGLLPLYEKIEPYDESLADKSPEERDAWGREVAQRLRPYIHYDRVMILADDLYAAPLRPYLPGAEYPLAGMDEDAQKAWLAP